MPRTPKPSGRKLRNKGQSLGKRLVNKRSLRPRFLIVCEGEKTEKYYFEHFPVNKEVVEVDVQGLGRSPLHLVKHARQLCQKSHYTQVWCVFDRDIIPAEDFNESLALAQREGIRVAYSNEAFELWFLLHFNLHVAASHRSQYQQMLSERLGKPYEKSCREMYDALEDLQSAAIRNAEHLLASYGPHHNPERDNPCTTVHQLVQELNRYIRTSSTCAPPTFDANH